MYSNMVRATVVGLAAVCVATGCSVGGEQRADLEKSSSAASNSPDEETSTAVFDGKGAEDGFETEPVKLSGDYSVTWEVSNNGTGERQESFMVALKSTTKETKRDLIIEWVSSGSGDEIVDRLDEGSYSLIVYAKKQAKWEISFDKK